MFRNYLLGYLKKIEERIILRNIFFFFFGVYSIILVKEGVYI